MNEGWLVTGYKQRKLDVATDIRQAETYNNIG
jgi:hypothetical protein